MELTHKCFWLSCAQASSGGFGIIVSRKLLSILPDVSLLEEIVPGRIVALRLRGEAWGLDIFSVHLVPALTPDQYIQQLSSVKAAIKPYSEAHSVLARDWNFDHEEEDRFDVEAATFSGNRGEVAKWWDAHLYDLMEWHQGDFTRSGTTRTGTKSLARLDRIYSNIDSADFLDLRIAAAAKGALDAETIRLSDHLPVEGRMSRPRPIAQLPPIATWVIKHSCWTEKVRIRYEEWIRSANQGSIWDQLHGKRCQGRD